MSFFSSSIFSKRSSDKTDTSAKWVDKHVLKPDLFGAKKSNGHPLRGHILHDSEASLVNFAAYLKSNFQDDKELEDAFKILRKGGKEGIDRSYVTFFDENNGNINTESNLVHERTKIENLGYVEANRYLIEINKNDDPAHLKKVVVEAANHSKAGKSRLDYRKMESDVIKDEALEYAKKISLLQQSNPQEQWEKMPEKGNTLFERTSRGGWNELMGTCARGYVTEAQNPALVDEHRAYEFTLSPQPAQPEDDLGISEVSPNQDTYRSRDLDMNDRMTIYNAYQNRGLQESYVRIGQDPRKGISALQRNNSQPNLQTTQTPISHSGR